MGFLRKAVVFCFVLGGAFLSSASADAALSRAEFTYEQALRSNDAYFELLSRYRGAVDAIDEHGDTAYCLALKDRNLSVQRFLISQGANPYHSCAGRFNNQQAEQVAKRKAEQAKVARRYQNNTSSFIGDSNTYLWAGVGALAVGGGVALAAGGGGGGGGHSGGHDSTPTTGSKPLPDLGKEDSNPLAQVFKTDEYKRGNFLEGIRAAEAYSHIYEKDEEGELVGHQAGSDAALKTIKVGVVDTGVFTNKDVEGSVAGRYDINKFSKGNSIWMKANSDGSVQAYVVRQGSTYYAFHVHRKWDDKSQTYVKEFEPIWQRSDGSYTYGFEDPSEFKQKINWGFDKETVEQAMRLFWRISLDDMALVNGGAGLSGVSTIGLDPNLIVKDLGDTWLATVGGVNHGTHVAGIIAADKNDTGMHGVAFENAEILGASWDMYDNSNISGVVKQMVKDGVDVINNSWGKNISLDKVGAFEKTKEGYKLEVPEAWNAYVHAAKNDVVWVQSTGNQSKAQPDYFVGMGAIDLSADGYQKSSTAVPYLAVAALDPATQSADAVSGKLAWYSNACGSAAGYCLAAPGTNVLSTAASKEGNVYLSGTSMATPVVSGSIALLNGYYPWLNAQNVAYLLLETANKKGVYANSAVYGQGALDLEAAVTTPLGGLRLPENGSLSSLSSVNASRLSLSGPMQKQMLKAMPKTVTAFDILDRPFQYETAKLINITHASNANLRNSVSKMATGGVTKTTKDEKTGFQFTTEEALNNGGWANLSSAEVVSETDTGATRFYYAVNSKYATKDNVLKASYNPYLAMNEAYGAENILKLSNSSKLKLALQTGENGLYERDYEQDKHSFDERSYALFGEYSLNLTDYLEVATLGGMLFENDAMLGMNGRGAFGVKDSSTYYMGVKAVLNLTADFSLLAAYYRGYTQGGEAAMLSVSDLETESFMLAGEYKLNKTDKVGLSFSSPLSVVKGKASVLFARGRDNYSDKVYMQKLTSSLKPEAKEYDLGMYYQGEPTENVNLLGKVEARFNADGEKGVTDYIGMVGAGVAF